MSVRDQSASTTVVIIVEDDGALLQALRFMFFSEGFHTLACESGEELVGLSLPDERFCMVIDERLPGMTGLAALQALRDRGVEAPALVITTDPGAALFATADRTHAVVVEKPLVGDILLVAVKAALANGALLPGN